MVKREGGKQHQLPTLGWREWAALPMLGIQRVKAKVDTGARSSALHAVHIAPFESNGVQYVRFAVHPNQRTADEDVLAEARVADVRTVKSSGGHTTRRYVIETSLALGGLVWPIELTLTPRAEMGFRMLIGREAMRGRFLVDPGRSFIQSDARATGIPKPRRAARTENTP